MRVEGDFADFGGFTGSKNLKRDLKRANRRIKKFTKAWDKQQRGTNGTTE